MSYLTTTWGNKKMPYRTFMMLLMTRLLLNARSVKVILVTEFYDWNVTERNVQPFAIHQRREPKRPKLQQPSVIVPDLLSLVSDNSSLPQAMLLKSTIHKTKSSVWWLCVDRCGAIKGLCKMTANLCLCQPAQQLLNMWSQTLVSYRPNWEIYLDYLKQLN